MRGLGWTHTQLNFLINFRMSTRKAKTLTLCAKYHRLDSAKKRKRHCLRLCSRKMLKRQKSYQRWLLARQRVYHSYRNRVNYKVTMAPSFTKSDSWCVDSVRKLSLMYYNKNYRPYNKRARSCIRSTKSSTSVRMYIQRCAVKNKLAWVYTEHGRLICHNASKGRRKKPSWLNEWDSASYCWLRFGAAFPVLMTISFK